MSVEHVAPPAVAIAGPPAPRPRRASRAARPVRGAGAGRLLAGGLAALAALALAPGAAAEGRYASGRVYAEVQAGGGNVRVSDLQFYPPLGGVTVGAYVVPGIGLELHAEGGIDADEDGGFELGLDESAGVALRFESPPVAGLSGYVTLGYAVWTLSQEPEDAAGGALEVEEEFGGVRASIGLVERLRRVPALSVSGEFRTLYTDDGLHLTALLLGLRLSVP